MESLLYYPSINIPSLWIKKAILYSDNIYSIVPREFPESVRFEISPDQEYLKKIELYKPLFSDQFFKFSDAGAKIDEFKEELRVILSSLEFKKLSIKKTMIKNYIHREKFSMSILEVLKEFQAISRSDHTDGLWVEMERETSIIYMSLLAKYIANSMDNVTKTSTDFENYHKIIYSGAGYKNSAIVTNLLSLLPVPADTCSIKEIVHFKNKRKDELLSLRLMLDSVMYEMQKCSSNDQIIALIEKQKKTITKSITDTLAAMKDSKLKSVFGSLKALIEIKTPAWIPAVGVANNLPVEVNTAVSGIAFMIHFGYSYFTGKTEINKIRRDSPVTYLTDAKNLGIVN